MEQSDEKTTEQASRSEFTDEYEGREGLLKLPYKLLLRESEVRNGQLLSEIDELKDTVIALKARVFELEKENRAIQRGELKEYGKQVRREEIYRSQAGEIAKLRETVRSLRETNSELMSRLLRLEKR